jgi:8-oxo-dGTP pyrophosphatase MutT (NUDIX family)
MTSTRGPWKILREKRLHETPWIGIDEYEVVTPAGTPGVYTAVDFKHWAVSTLALDDEGYTYVVGQYRFPLQHYGLELPGGGGEKDADPLASAQRELLEETGISAATWQLLYEFHPSKSSTNEKAFIFLARDLTFGAACPDEEEELELKKILFTDLLAMVYSNQIMDGLTVVGVLMAEKALRETTA